MSQVNRTCTLNKSLQVAYVSEVLSISLEENIQQESNCKVRSVGDEKVRNILNNYSQPIL